MTAFVLYGKDKVLAHPAMLDPQYSGQLSAKKPLLSIDEIGDPVLAQFPSLTVVNLPSSADFDLRDDGQPRRAERSSCPFHRRSSARCRGKSACTSPSTPSTSSSDGWPCSIAISLGLLDRSLVAAALILARRIARPIRAVSAAAGKIEHLDLDAIEPLPGSRIRELDEQAQSFNRMVNGLRWFRTYVPHQLVRRLMRLPAAPPPRCARRS